MADLYQKFKPLLIRPIPVTVRPPRFHVNTMPIHVKNSPKKERFNYFRILLFVVISGVILWVPLPLPSPPPTDRFIRIEARSFQYAPEVISLNPGDRVTIELVSTDVVHGFSLDGYALNLRAEPGQPARATFFVNRIGVFRFRCLVVCGNLHPFMIGKLQIGENFLFLRSMVLAGLGILFGLNPLIQFSNPLSRWLRDAN